MLLHFSVLHYIALHYIVLHYSVLHYSVLHNSVLHYSVLHYILLHYSILHYSVLHYTVLNWIGLDWTALHWSSCFFFTFSKTIFFYKFVKFSSSCHHNTFQLNSALIRWCLSTPCLPSNLQSDSSLPLSRIHLDSQTYQYQDQTSPSHKVFFSPPVPAKPNTL